MTEHTLDAVALAVKAFVVTDSCDAVGFWWDDRSDPALLEIPWDRIGVAGLIGEKSVRRLLWQIDQRVVHFAVGCFSGREVERDRSTSGIIETMNFTGEPAPRAA